MKAYSIFDDFSQEALDILEAAGMEVTVHPLGVLRPDSKRMKAILEEYDCVIIGTSQKITEDMFDNVKLPRIIATASVGVDHIKVPDKIKGLVTIINTPKANAQSVAEYTMACALNCVKRLGEGKVLYQEGKDNKSLFQKPEDLAEKTIGVIGAGNISVRIMEYARFFGMRILCWTNHPDRHRELTHKGVVFTGLSELALSSDVISVNLPNHDGTRGLISSELVKLMKPTAIFISVSRVETIDYHALLHKAVAHRGFYVCLDIDVNEDLRKSIPHTPNVLITPHIAGGTVETRKRMFREVADSIARMVKEGTAR